MCFNAKKYFDALQIRKLISVGPSWWLVFFYGHGLQIRASSVFLKNRCFFFKKKCDF